MSYEMINPIQQFNFQINRVMTYGKAACDPAELRRETASISNLDDWNRIWASLAAKAEAENQLLHAAYYYRMLEFFMKESNPAKNEIYDKCIDLFYRGFEHELQLSYEHVHVRFENGFLNCLKMNAAESKGTVLVCGGYDSFIEEFVLQVAMIAQRGYDVILFEGPGQGDCLRQKMYFRYDFERPAAAVIDYFNIEKCAFVGISWGGYFALRCAAFDSRITAAVAYDVMYDGFEVMTGIFPTVICKIIRYAFRQRAFGLIDFITDRIRKKSIIADWALSQGLYITGTNSVHEFYEKLSQHSLRGIEDKIIQDILLLAGEKDHYIPACQFHTLKNKLHNAKSLSCRLFTEAEGGEQHCQIGNHMLAVNTILDWLDSL